MPRENHDYWSMTYNPDINTVELVWKGHQQ